MSSSKVHNLGLKVTFCKSCSDVSFVFEAEKNEMRSTAFKHTFRGTFTHSSAYILSINFHMEYKAEQMIACLSMVMLYVHIV